MALASAAHPERRSVFAELRADWSWVRFQRARLRGDVAAALHHAHGALAARPEELSSWVWLADYLAFELASPTATLEPEERRLWFDAALATVAAAEDAGHPARALELWRGLAYWNKAQHDPALDAAGRDGLTARAVDAFRAAGEPELAQRLLDELGIPPAVDLEED